MDCWKVKTNPEGITDDGLMEFRLVKISQTWHNWCAYHRGETRIRWKINHQVSTSTIFHLSCISDRYKSYYVMLKCLIVLWTSTIVHHEINLLLEFQILGIVVRAMQSLQNLQCSRYFQSLTDSEIFDTRQGQLDMADLASPTRVLVNYWLATEPFCRPELNICTTDGLGNT